MAGSKKLELIEQTYRLLQAVPPSEVKIRAVAEAAECSTTAVYKHFDDLDDLVRIASVRFLENYICRTQAVLSETADPMEVLTITWREFAAVAFENIDVYLELFWGRYKSQLGDAIFTYYQLFPQEWKQLGGLFTSTFFNNEIKERNYIIVRRAAAMGYFCYDDAKLISDLQCYLIHGVLLDYRETYRDPQKAREGFDYFMTLLESTLRRYRLK